MPMPRFEHDTLTAPTPQELRRKVAAKTREGWVVVLERPLWVALRREIPGSRPPGYKGAT